MIPYVIILWFGLSTLGVAGAACAWTCRVTADAILLFRGARFTRIDLVALLPLAGTVCTASLSSLVIGDWLVWHILIGASFLAATLVWAWYALPSFMKIRVIVGLGSMKELSIAMIGRSKRAEG
jgi:hypothetical protein